MLRYYAKRSLGEQFEELSTPLESGVWAHAEAIADKEVDELVEKFGLDRNIIRDVYDENELPRVEFSEDKEYVFLRVPQRTKKGDVEATPLLAIVDHSNYFTISTQANLLPHELIASSIPPHGGANSALLLGTIAALVAKYGELIQFTSDTIKSTGHRLKTHEVTNKDFIHFVTVEDNLNEYKMNLGGMLGVTGRLSENNHKIFNAADIEAIEDISLHLQQLLVAVETHAQNVDSIRKAYSTVANHTLNQRMKTLTILTVLITLPNVLTGMYGMNVLLPYADQPWAYAAIMGLIAALVLIAYLLAKRLKVF
ncbi:MAG: CorA family divalent cation transporter [Candidatus Saccharibacteria bacterium]